VRQTDTTTFGVNLPPFFGVQPIQKFRECRFFRCNPLRANRATRFHG
jgi:hypothetical protein